MGSDMETILPQTSRAKGDEVRQEQVVKKQKEYKMIGRRKKVPGHTLFEFNVNTKELKPAMRTREVYATFNGQSKYRNKAEVHEGCLYIQALNIKNAEKKLHKIGML